MAILTDRIILKLDWEGNHNGNEDEERYQHQQQENKRKAELFFDLLNDLFVEPELHTLPEQPPLDSSAALLGASLQLVMVVEVVIDVDALLASDIDERECLGCPQTELLVLSDVQKVSHSDSLR